jgi:hypothetical protein
VVRALRESFPNTMIIPALGNHDSQPADFYADPAINTTVANTQYSGEFHPELVFLSMALK